jgi:hypothetical protein
MSEILYPSKVLEDKLKFIQSNDAIISTIKVVLDEVKRMEMTESYVIKLGNCIIPDSFYKEMRLMRIIGTLESGVVKLENVSFIVTEFRPIEDEYGLALIKVQFLEKHRNLMKNDLLKSLIPSAVYKSGNLVAINLNYPKN